METSASLVLKATKEEVWDIVSNIEKAKDRIECIKDIQILERPENGLVGLKWQEKREVFGKEATETMWITEAKENEYYIAEAKNSGCLYHSKVSIEPSHDGVNLVMSFQSTPQTFMARLMSPLMFMMKGVIKKAFVKDLQDIQKYLEVLS